jgi:phage repressor protein C with HTH and peptisase S24 domain
MERQDISKRRLADLTGIPYTTIVGFYAKGYTNIKLSTLKKLSGFFGVSMDCLADDEAELPDMSPRRVSEIERKYSSLSRKGQTIVSDLIDGLLDYDAPETAAPAEPVYIREYLTPAAAGYASPAEGEDYILVEKPPEAPDKTDFAVRIDGDSMEPYIADGSRVYVARTNELSPGDVGIFFVDGHMKCKQYCEDSFGNIYLFSLNRARSDADVTIMATSGITVFCFGKVLLKKRPPLP